MNNKKRLLIISHAPSVNTKEMLSAVIRGASNSSLDGVDIISLAPLEACPADIIAADAIILGATENLGYMAGLVKDLFDRCYYPCLDHTQGKPFAYYIRAGFDGTGTQRGIESIITGLRWRVVQAPLICKGEFHDDFIAQCEELGLYIAASLESGII
ncbi:flavodoxin family protein [Paraperlucidibaca sp.]|jgi:multimeric flavodoxin WrbA|uniref:flavodoxin family protein n=1 Tax=Paraperlucidibaca sp. TaxID=2708021 RepID=UPI003989FA9A